MTAHPIDTEALRARAEHVYRHGGPANAVESLAANVPEILDRLAAAEHRATRAEAQSAIRGRAVVIYRERARQAEAERDCRRRENAELRDELVATQEYGAKLAHGKDEAEARIKAVQALHTGTRWPSAICDACDQPRPCPTIRALDGDT